MFINGTHATILNDKLPLRCNTLLMDGVDEPSWRDFIFMPPKIDLPVKKVLHTYLRLRNIHKVAEVFDVSTRPIIRILKLIGVTLTNRRYSVNYNYFDVIDTEEKAYWLGFLC